MTKRLVFIAILIAGIIFISALVLSRKTAVNEPLKSPSPIATDTPSPKEVNFTASFDIYTKGTKRIFTDSRYHNKSEDVYVESVSPNTVVVKKEGVTWSGFFATLPMSLTKDCLITGTKQTFCAGTEGTLRFFVNDIEDNDSLDREIKSGDRLLVEFK